jgi:hypothetical protein
VQGDKTDAEEEAKKSKKMPRKLAPIEDRGKFKKNVATMPSNAI